MTAPVSFVLVHSPIVGPFTWSLVAQELRARGIEAITPELPSGADTATPLWEQHARAAAGALRAVPPDPSVVLVGHSGAGVLLPQIRAMAGRAAAGYVFVDAGLPRDRAPRVTGAEAARMREVYEAGERFPSWTDETLADAVPDPALRRQLIAEMRPQPWRFWDEPIPTFSGWPDAPCAYLRFGENRSYDDAASEAQRRGWPLVRLEGDHFHMLVDPSAVADALITLTRRMGVDA